MYQPRRVADQIEIPVQIHYEDYATAAAANPGPRRARQTMGDMVRAKATPTALAMAVTTGAAAFIVAPSFTQADQATTGIPAEGRQTQFVSRDQVRPVSEAPADAEAAGSEQAEAPAPKAVENPKPTSNPIKQDWGKDFAKVAGNQYAKGTVVVREAPTSKSKKIGSLKWGEKIQVTELVSNGYREVIFGKKLAYVYDAEISKKKPIELATDGAGGRMAPGKTSSKSVLGLTPKAMVVYNAVMSRWGGNINSVGGWRSRSLSVHQYGRAIDFMLTPGKESAMGWDIARFLAANHKTFGVDHIIFEQKIWTPYRQTWRPMASRGSITANHWDHVHVAIKA